MQLCSMLSTNFSTYCAPNFIQNTDIWITCRKQIGLECIYFKDRNFRVFRVFLVIFAKVYAFGNSKSSKREIMDIFQNARVFSS